MTREHPGTLVDAVAGWQGQEVREGAFRVRARLWEVEEGRSLQ